METKNLTMLFADMVGSTEMSMSSKRGEDQSLQKEVLRVMEESITGSCGKLVKSTGDGCLVTFESPTSGVLAGLRFQQKIKSWAKKQKRPVHFRVGIHTGEVTIDKRGDAFGAAANIASRIESVAEPGRVFISATTYQVMNRAEVRAEFVDERNLKGIGEKIGLYNVLFEGESPGRSALYVNKVKWIAAALAVLLAAFTAWHLWTNHISSHHGKTEESLKRNGGE
jgi:class 3 adenylate cyclase